MRDIKPQLNHCIGLECVSHFFATAWEESLADATPAYVSSLLSEGRCSCVKAAGGLDGGDGGGRGVDVVIARGDVEHGAQVAGGGAE